METLARIASDGRGEDITIIGGDLNEWRPDDAVLRPLHSLMGRPPAPRTYPALWPLWPLDRLWVWPAPSLLDVGRTEGRISAGRLRPPAADCHAGGGLKRPALRLTIPANLLVGRLRHSLPIQWRRNPPVPYRVSAPAERQLVLYPHRFGEGESSMLYWAAEPSTV